MPKTKKRMPAVALAAAMILSLLPGALAAEEAAPLTREEVRDILLAAAGDYREGLREEDILQGDENGELHLDRTVTRAEALVMLERAFGGLPEPTGANAINAFPAETFTDVPQWAETELTGVFRAGIVAGTGQGTMSPDRPVTEAELDLLVRRVYALEGSNLKDDFYAAVNKKWQDEAEIPMGQVETGDFADLVYEVYDQVYELIQEVAADPGKSEAEQKIAALYNTAIDMDSRDEAGVEPIQKYLDGIDKAETVDELMAVELEIEKDTELGLMVGFGIGVDMVNSDQYALSFGTYASGMPRDFYLSGDQETTELYLNYLTDLFEAAGVEEDRAGEEAQMAYALEQEIAQAGLDVQDFYDAEKIYNLYTIDQLRALFPKGLVDGALKNTGFRSEESIQVSDVGAMEALAESMTEENLPALKALLKRALLENTGDYLNREIFELKEQFEIDYYGINSEPDAEWGALVSVSDLMSDYLGRIYVENYFSAAAKADVEEMIGEIIDVYRDRIRALDWMSEDTKAMAIKKLDNMTAKVGYPESWDTYLDQAEIRSPEAGGTYYENVMAIHRAMGDEMRKYQGSRVDRGAWDMPAYEVNAYYDSSFNEIVFPAAILQPPIYDVEASREENLGKIGDIIAHEITHAFDDGGAKYDEKGNYTDWWTEEDYAAFREKCGVVAAWFDGQESAPGVACNGERTLSENVADLGAAACVVEVASRMEDPDYDTLFRSLAQLWNGVVSRSYQQYLIDMDTHAAGKVRVNRVLQTLDQFYETYEIGPGDGMWTEPESRAKIW